MIIWKQGGDWHITARHKGTLYTISKAIIDGKPCYTTWIGDKRGTTFNDLEKAKESIEGKL